MPSTIISDYHADYLIKLQTDLRNLLYVRPYNLKAIEHTATLLCDSVAIAVEGECDHFSYYVVPDSDGKVWQCKFCGSTKVITTK